MPRCENVRRGAWRPGALCQLPKWLMALDVGPPILYIRLMNKDNAYAFAQFSVIGGHDYEGETFYSMRLFGDYELACDYARDLVNEGYDYAYVAGVYADGTMGLKEVIRVADDGPSVVDLG